MKLLPRSLFHRNLLLIVSLIVLGQIGNAIVYRDFVMRPRIRMDAEATARNLEAAGLGLRTLPPEQRTRFVQAFNTAMAKPLQPARADGWLTTAHPPAHRLTVLEQEFVDHIAHRLALQGSQLKWRREPSGSLALSFDLNGDGLWLDMPGLVPGRQYSVSWLAASASAALLALLGAWLIQRRINRPLQALVQAAQTLAHGDKPPPLVEDGPSEIATVAHGFNDMMAALTRHERERMLMLAGLSHDLRTPLAKMRLATEMLQGQGDAELLASLNRNVESLDELLGQFLDFVRLSGHGWKQESLRDTDLNALIADVLSTQPRHPAAQDLIFLPGPVAPQALRQQAVQRLVQNLITNAQRHGAPPIEVQTGQDSHGCWLEVRDRGPGIAPDCVEALKAPFSRGQSARSGTSGAGLGLAIVERIAASHQARFELLARPGGGLIARIHWPMHAMRDIAHEPGLT